MYVYVRGPVLNHFSVVMQCRHVQTTLKDHFTVRRSTRKCKSVLKVCIHVHIRAFCYQTSVMLVVVIVSSHVDISLVCSCMFIMTQCLGL